MNGFTEHNQSAAELYRSSDLSDADDALRYVPPDCDRERWAEIGMALKSEFGEAAFSVFDSWSQGGAKYKAEDCRSTWRSIATTNPDGPSVTIATLFARARDGGYKPRKNGDYRPVKAAARPPITVPVESPEEAARKREIAHKYWSESKPNIPH